MISHSVLFPLLLSLVLKLSYVMGDCDVEDMPSSLRERLFELDAKLVLKTLQSIMHVEYITMKKSLKELKTKAKTNPSMRVAVNLIKQYVKQFKAKVLPIKDFKSPADLSDVMHTKDPNVLLINDTHAALPLMISLSSSAAQAKSDRIVAQILKSHTAPALNLPANVINFIKHYWKNHRSEFRPPVLYTDCSLPSYFPQHILYL